MAYFPMYVDITNKDCLIVGGGKVALRKVEVLLDFKAKVCVVAEEVCEQIKTLEDEGKITVLEREFKDKDIEKRFLVVAATNQKELNHRVSMLASQKNIPVNAVDQIEDCYFIFPAYVKERELVAAFSSSGKSPVTAQYLKKKEKEILTPRLGEINDYLGAIRQEIIEKYDDEKQRKAAFKEILEKALLEEI